MMRAIGLLLVLACWPGSASAQDFGPIVENMYRNAIVKIEVSSNTPVFDGSRNRCLSEGTGFLVNRSHVVTAYHVLAIPPECGAPVILIKSRPKFKLQMAGKLVGEENDIALLAVPPVDKLCSLVLSAKNAFSTSAFRYFMPKGIDEPEPVKATVGDGDGPYQPLISLTGSDAFPGDSGGPVIHFFNVIGMLKARHETYNNLNFMITADRVIAILSKFGITRDGSECNPAMYSVAVGPAPDQVIFVAPPNSELPSRITAAAMREATQQIAKAGTPMFAEVILPRPSGNGSGPQRYTTPSMPIDLGTLQGFRPGHSSNWNVGSPPASPGNPGNIQAPVVIPPPRPNIIAGYNLPGYPGMVAKPDQAFERIELDLKAVPDQSKIASVQQFGTQLNSQIASFYWDAVMAAIPADRSKK